MAVLAYRQGRSVREIANWLQVSRQIIYRWLDLFERSRDKGLALLDAPRSGRPSQWDLAMEVALMKLLKHLPSELGFFASQWTVPLLQEQLRNDVGVLHSEHTVRRALHRLGYVWKRARYQLIPDPEREKKTPDSARHWAFAGSMRAIVRGRNRRAAVPASKGHLVAARTADSRAAHRA
jgi:transposase